MSDLVQIRIRLFGAFRNLVPTGEIQMSVVPEQTLLGLRIELGHYFRALNSSFDSAALLDKSVFANDRSILRDSDQLQVKENTTYALLPPVCGG
jgi:molybdopterin converting factor small subunit